MVRDVTQAGTVNVVIEPMYVKVWLPVAEQIFIARHAAVPDPQVLSAVTHTLPEAEPKVTVMPVVPCPAVTVAPGGTVHV
jgi:hypothetical protein